MDLSDPRDQATFHRRTANAVGNHARRAKAAGRALRFHVCALRQHVRQAVSCAYCGRVLTAANFTLDHKVSVDQGGGFGLDNLAVCCEPCNQAKGVLGEREFRELLAALAWWPPRSARDVLTRLRIGGRVKGGRR